MRATRIPSLADVLQALIALDVVPELGNDHQAGCVFDARPEARGGQDGVAQSVLGPEGVVVRLVPGKQGKSCLDGGYLVENG